MRMLTPLLIVLTRAVAALAARAYASCGGVRCIWQRHASRRENPEAFLSQSCICGIGSHEPSPLSGNDLQPCLLKFPEVFYGKYRNDSFETGALL